jgi:hypothetical protein
MTRRTQRGPRAAEHLEPVIANTLESDDEPGQFTDMEYYSYNAYGTASPDHNGLMGPELWQDCVWSNQFTSESADGDPAL